MCVGHLEERAALELERPVTRERRTTLVRGDDDRRPASGRMPDQALQDGPAACVEATGRLIEEQQIGIERGRDREGNATHLAKAQLERRTRCEMAGAETHAIEGFFRALSRRFDGEAAALETEADLLHHRFRKKETLGTLRQIHDT